MNSLKIKSINLQATDKIAQTIANSVEKQGCLFCLYGDIGAGKTTLVRAIARYLEVQEKVTSPSFVILNEYHSGKISIYHFDLYRLEEEGVNSILEEIREYTEKPNAVTFVEWAQFDAGELPDNRIELKIDYINERSRNFSFQANGDKAEKILETIQEGLQQ
jgi:tRNA threonylcarbamoyladenosine biosynthesis protein TsaE